MKLAVTPHKISSKQTTCNTERPSYKQSPPSNDKSPIKSVSKNHNKENYDLKSPESANSKQMQRKKPRSLINQSKILKILNLTTKYEGPEDYESEMPNFHAKSQINNKDNQEFVNSFSMEPRKNSQKSLKNEKNEKNQRNSQKRLIESNDPQENSRKSVKKPASPRVFTLDEALKYPLEYYESFESQFSLEKTLDSLIQNFSIKALMVKIL